MSIYDRGNEVTQFYNQQGMPSDVTEMKATCYGWSLTYTGIVDQDNKPFIDSFATVKLTAKGYLYILSGCFYKDFSLKYG